MAREKTPEENAADNERKQLVEEKKNLKKEVVNLKKYIEGIAYNYEGKALEKNIVINIF